MASSTAPPTHELATLSTSLEPRLSSLLSTVSTPQIASTWSVRLLATYVEPQRSYHTLTHIAALLALLASCESVADRTALELVVWFHDCVYDPKVYAGKGANEEASVLLWEEFANESAADGMVLDQEMKEKVARVIRCTISHEMPGEGKISDEERKDTARFLDWDLSILASAPAAYKQYARQIREEYAFYPWSAYREGRITVLRRFMEREGLFFSDGAAAVDATVWEEQARMNLTEEIKELQSRLVE